MAWVNYQRVLDGTSVSGKYGESLQITERWQIRVDSPTTSKVDILTGVSTTAGVTWGSSHFEFPALKAMEFELSPEGKDGMRWGLTVKYYIPPPNKRIQVNGIPEDVWDRTGGTTSIPAFTDKNGLTITNSAGDPLEGLEREREETSWGLTKCYQLESDLNNAVTLYAGKVNAGAWAGGAAETWKCYFKGASKKSISKLDGDDDAGTLEFIESKWEFRYEPETWRCMPWDVGFMEVVSGERKTITGNDGKPVKQPVALESNGSKKSPGSPPDVINDGEGVELYESTDWSAGLGTPEMIAT